MRYHSAASTVHVATSEDLERLEQACEREGAARGGDQLARFLAEQQAGLRLFLVAYRDTAVAGYVTIAWNADYLPFRHAGIPEIHDLYVLPSARRSGVANSLLQVAEGHAAQRSGHLGLAVGLYADYGPAQRLYTRLGYLADGTGATAGGRPLLGGETVSVDDGLVLHLVKPLRG